MGRRVLVVLATTISCQHAWGQLVISAKSGLINHVEGLVLLSGEPVVRKPSARVEMKEGSELRAEDGRAEVLLNPGLFLRIGENSTVRMVSNDLTSTRIEFVSGAAIIGPGRRVNATENWASFVSIVYQETIVHLTAGAGEMIALANPGPPREFDVKAIDSLGLWSKRRAAYISTARESTVRRRSPGVWPRAQIPIISH